SLGNFANICRCSYSRAWVLCPVIVDHGMERGADMRGLLLSGLMVALASSSASYAAEVSLLSGLYKQEKEKRGGEDAGDRSEIELGGRYADEYDVGMDWFGEAALTMRSYDAPSGQTSPSDSTSLNLGGGL